MRNTIDILGVPVDKITMREAVDKLYGFISDKGAHAIYTPNAEIMMAAQRDSNLKEILSNADLLVADGAGVVLASKILKRRLPEKVSGIDLVKETLLMPRTSSLRLFLFGSKPGIAETAGENIIKQYPDVEIAGCRNGYFSDADENEIINQINSANADILLVALGAPKQEKWIAKHKDKLNVKVCAGVGGTLDVFAGNVKLAPDFFRRNGLEWLYRLYKEPWRFKRMLDLPKFVLRVVWARLTDK
ncbi:MAG TPA: WecB/TagA/CpsF family glycosyltransferase [Clostridia bacterium]|nr:WecB/TagA/CpsF family glycosyltransferase [Clostridia bacterium]